VHCCKGEQKSNGLELSDRSERLIVINAQFLAETSSNQASLLSFNRPI